MTQSLFEHIRSFTLFAACSDDFIRAFASLAQSETVAAGTLILKEGNVTEKLYVLSQGEVEVLVEGEKVAILNTPGDPMGEISFLTSRVTTASLQAKTSVTYLVIQTQDLDRYVQTSKGDFGYQLYRAFASVLSAKIIRTNEKAKRFEEANRALNEALASLEEANHTLEEKVKQRTRDLESKKDELQRSYLAVEAQNSELIASHRKLEELYSTKDMTFKRLNELQTQYLTPLIQDLEALEGSASSDAQPRIEKAKAQVEHSIAMLMPMSELYSTEQAVRSRRVLLAESDRKQQVVSKLALGGTGVRLDIASNAQEAIDKLTTGSRYDLVFVSSDLAHLIPDVRNFLPQAKLVFMASCNVPAELPILKVHGAAVSNIVSRHPDDRTFTVKNIATTVNKLISSDLFGMEKYLIWGVEVQSRWVNSSADRSPMIEEMKEYFSKLGVRSTIADRAGTVAEELLMNAIYDAPVGPDSRHLYNQLARTEKVQLQAHERAQFRFACDGMLAAISVSDPFGGFKMQTLLNYLERNYSKAQDEVQEAGKGGAGRGLHQIIENSDLVVFNVQNRRRTEVISLFNLDAKAVVEGAKPSFHFFMS